MYRDDEEKRKECIVKQAIKHEHPKADEGYEKELGVKKPEIVSRADKVQNMDEESTGLEKGDREEDISLNVKVVEPAILGVSPVSPDELDEDFPEPSLHNPLDFVKPLIPILKEVQPLAFKEELDDRVPVPLIDLGVRMGLRILAPTFENPASTGLGEIPDEVPEPVVPSEGIVSVVRPIFREALHVSHRKLEESVPNLARMFSASREELSLLKEVEAEKTFQKMDLDLIGEIFVGGSPKEFSERPLIVLAVRPDEKRLDYIELLKRIMREVYRVRSGGLPFPRHVSHDFNSVRMSIKAGESVYVIDLRDTQGAEPEDLKEFLTYLKDRIRELYSQKFGFLVVYGEDSLIKTVKEIWGTLVMPEEGRTYHKLPPFIRLILAQDLGKILTVINLFFGRLGNGELKVDLDDYVLFLEDIFYHTLEALMEDPRTALLVNPSKGEDEEGLGGESFVHYATKAFVVRYLLDKEKVKVERIKTEYDIGGGVIDVYVLDPEKGDVAIEVETLYGTFLPQLKLKERIESRMSRGLKTWIVIPNPQFVTYFREISYLRRVYKKRYGDWIEFYTLDIEGMRLISFEEIREYLMGKGILRTTNPS